MSRTPRVIAAAVLAAPMMMAPTAAAVVPPVVDNARLPPAAPPKPVQPTELRQPCFSASAHATGAVTRPLGLDAVWQLTRGAGQTIAVIDTGVARHRLLPHLAGGGDYVSGGDGTADCDGHGTIVAGIAGGAPTDDGFSGVAPDATILAIRQSSNKFAVEGEAAGVGDVTTLAQAVRTAADLGAGVINISSVACVAADRAPDDGALGAALAYAVDVKNVVVVAAAGNVGGPGHCPAQNGAAGPPDWEHVRTIASPAWYDDLVLCVGSVGPDGVASQFTLAGPWVDVAAPGEQVVSLHPDGEQLIDRLGEADPISGTSYAAPMVAGIAALVRARFPQLTAREVMRRIETTARRPPGGWDPLVGNGIVDALAATSDGGQPVTAAARPVSTVTAPTAGQADDGSRRVAFGGAAICVVLGVALAVSVGRLRRGASGGQPVTDD
ncbi:type VII secretion-associated serine protease mycosin [Mycolicibacterium mageritense]